MHVVSNTIVSTTAWASTETAHPTLDDSTQPSQPSGALESGARPVAGARTLERVPR